MNLEREDKISLREMGEIISDIGMLFVDVESIVLDEKIEEVSADQRYEGEKEFHQGGKLLNMFDDNINAIEHIDLMHNVKVSCENVMNHISLTFVNEKLCLKNFSFHPFISHENNIDEVNVDLS